MDKLKYLFSYEYLIQTGLKSLTSTDKVYWLLALILLALGIFAFIYKYGKNPLTRALAARWDHMLLTTSLLALVWTLFRYQLVNTLSAHIFIFIVYLVGLVWAVKIARYYFGKYKVQLADYQREEMKKKYM